jgi:hypothetical protein
MSKPAIPPHQKIPIFQLSVVFVSVIIILQLWLLTSSLDQFLAGDTRICLPAAAASGLCVALCWWLLRVVTRDTH